MKKYIRKPDSVDAVQFDGDVDKLLDWAASVSKAIVSVRRQGIIVRFRTCNGDESVNIGDYVIHKDDRFSIMSCPDFMRKYERVE